MVCEEDEKKINVIINSRTHFHLRNDSNEKRDIIIIQLLEWRKISIIMVTL
jgi:hypothetical protein